MMIAIFLLAFSVFGMGYGIVRKKPDMVVIMVFMVLFSAWCVKYGHCIGMNPEPVHFAERSIRI